MSIIEVKGLTKDYGRGRGVFDVSFSVEKGQVFGFLGPNGAGKTTTIKSILSMIHYDQGEILYFDAPHSHRTHEWLGVVVDATLYDEEWKVRDVERIVRPFYSQWDAQLFDQLLKSFNVDRAKRVKELSRGMNVKLMLAVALSHGAKLLVLDEPTSGLDPVARDEICDILSEYVSDGTRSVLFSTHITTDLEKIAHDVTFILEGQIVFTGKKDDLLKTYALVKGESSAINDSHKKLIHGIRRNQTEFEGITLAEHIPQLPGDLTFAPPTLDDIVVCMNRRATNG